MNAPVKRPLPVKSITFFAVVLITCLAFVSWTNRRYPDTGRSPQQYREELRLRKLEETRARNYVENIKPHIPAR